MPVRLTQNVASPEASEADWRRLVRGWNGPRPPTPSGPLLAYDSALSEDAADRPIIHEIARLSDARWRVVVSSPGHAPVGVTVTTRALGRFPRVQLAVLEVVANNRGRPWMLPHVTNAEWRMLVVEALQEKEKEKQRKTG